MNARWKGHYCTEEPRQGLALSNTTALASRAAYATGNPINPSSVFVPTAPFGTLVRHGHPLGYFADGNIIGHYNLVIDSPTTATRRTSTTPDHMPRFGGLRTSASS
jgi:hypothetical protein